jgi:hemerythrin superfamily protein
VDVLDLLKQDHQKVAGLIDEVQNAEADDERLVELANEIAQELTIHSELEESLFYPVLRDRAEEEEERVDVFEAFTEHDVVKHLLSLIGSGRRRTEPELFKAELQVLGENVKHHVREEESTIFALARELIDDDEREQIGEEVQEQKERLMTSGSRGRRKAAAARGGARGRKKTATPRGGGRKKAAARTGGGRKKTPARNGARKKVGGRKKR